MPGPRQKRAGHCCFKSLSHINPTPTKVMLEEHKTQVTPHQEKFARYLAIKAHAQQILPLLLPGAINNLRTTEASTSLNRKETERYRVGLFASMAGNAMIIAQCFDEAIEELKIEIGPGKPKKLARVVAFAREVIPILIPSSLQSLRNLNDKHPPATDEDARAAKVKEFEEMCEIAMIISQSFEEETQRAKGKFIHDDA